MIMDDFLLYGLIGGIGVAAVAGPLGCFAVWRRMAYFGDSLAHAALLGVAGGFLLSIDVTIAIAATCLLFAIGLVMLQQQHRIATDTLLGILSHAALAAGLVALGLMETLRVDLLGYLIGDILAVSLRDLVIIYVGGTFVLVILSLVWRPLLAYTVHEELARAEGVPVMRVRLAFTLLLAIVIAISMKIIGILLITSLLIIPAATARRFATTPEQMAVMAGIVGAIAVVAGLFASLRWDTPAGPSVVVAAFLLFLAGIALQRLRRESRR
jgi:zinc transport system permease protein